jgi:hypothetical protein
MVAEDVTVTKPPTIGTALAKKRQSPEAVVERISEGDDLPATAQAGTGLRDLGFFFGGIIPEAHGGDIGGDVLRLQYLNNIEINPGDIHTASDFGGELLGLIFRQRDNL